MKQTRVAGMQNRHFDEKTSITFQPLRVKKELVSSLLLRPSENFYRSARGRQSISCCVLAVVDAAVIRKDAPSK